MNIRFMRGENPLRAEKLNAALDEATRPAARLQVQWPIGTPIVNGTVYFVYDAPYDGVINSITHFCNVDSFTVALQINGVTISTFAPLPTPNTNTVGASFSAGQKISGVIGGVSGLPADALLSLNVTWSS